MANESRKNKQIANISLGIMAAGFAATIPFKDGALGLLHVGFEAGVIGGLADWFAVTALFRHPLGIPIPHTALLPRNRKKMSDGIVRVLEERLLAKESMIEKLNQLDLAEQLLPPLRHALQSAVYSERLPELLETALRSIPADKVVPLLSGEIRSVAARIDLEALLRGFLHRAAENGTDERLLDLLLERVEAWASTEGMRRELGNSAMQLVKSLNLGGIMQFAVNAFIASLDEDRLSRMLQNFILNKIHELKVPGTQRRAAIMQHLHSGLETLITRLAESGQLDQLRDELLNAFDLEGELSRLFEALREKGIAFLHDESFADRVWPLLSQLLDRFEANRELVADAEHWLKGQIVQLIERNHTRIGSFVEENLNRLDNDQLVELIEDKVGQDLQWIRVNGAVCGFLIGLVLKSIEMIVGSF
ncbi:uncharacterized membrane-anchored protein YjiN (DUF445 family) [Paenibacillus taihuensis]|uniref:Uncharacterized membrane-anchored protein YjiN (DUF445 family) n=1 Tax=Paenibacillus taihuensis TaxID=1156355 RepID=A0A3D9S808_9BACL|nr:DUF445 domain-containing protein [Paenibacillus taihuensis]REE86431.1 uncharacterized membrane-anchored protein YjiN (DUF445 family) [Paenibacillus taihuensis]